MTKTEAIEYLEKDIKLHELFNETKHQEKAIEALEMAIDALTKEPEEDCISREWVMDLYEEWKPMLATNVDGFGYALKCAPSVVPKREIPPNMEQVLIPKHCIVTPSDTVPSANTTQRNYNFHPEGNIHLYKLTFGETPHFTLCHPLIKQTVENMRFENIVASPYMPYDQANNEGELWVMNETSGVVEMKIFGIPKDWSDTE